MRAAGSILLLLGLAALVGGMLFFGTVMAPLVFLHLPAFVAGPFIRLTFPWYYNYIIWSAGVVAVGMLLRRDWWWLVVPLAVIGVTCGLWFVLLPLLDGDRAAHDAAGFTFLHQLSVWLNGAELLAAAMLLIRLAARIS